MNIGDHRFDQGDFGVHRCEVQRGLIAAAGAAAHGGQQQRPTRQRLTQGLGVGGAHLQVLESAGLILVERVGRFHFVGLLPEGADESLAAAVQRMPDHAGTLAGDLAPQLDAPRSGPASVGYSVEGSSASPLSAGASMGA